MVDFAGWEMPMLYRGIIDEHEQTRRSGSIFDVSHMGRISFKGKDTIAFLNKLLTRDVSKQYVGQSRYSLVCNEAGGVLDDVIISRDEKNWMMVCNASNREKLLKHFGDVRRKFDFDVDMADNTESTAMVAIQGPKVIDRLSGVLPGDLKGIKRYHFETSSFMMIKFTVFRSGYTGEDGIELVLPAKMANMAIKLLAGKGDSETSTIRLAGLGARDSLRLEAALKSYISFANVPAGFELLGGARYTIGALELFLLGGPGLGTSPGTPAYRILLGAAAASVAKPKEEKKPEPKPEPVVAKADPCVEGTGYDLKQCPDLDADGDGVKNGVDGCPMEPEDKDFYKDEDGCPDPDNDSDGIMDEADKCPNEPGIPEKQGCPFRDADKDGIEDQVDACPNEPGVPEFRGCPPQDQDKDGVFDNVDNCPT